jgi:hypothetical protein
LPIDPGFQRIGRMPGVCSREISVLMDIVAFPAFRKTRGVKRRGMGQRGER